MKMGRNGNMIENKIRGRKPSGVVEYPSTWNLLLGICILLKV